MKRIFFMGKSARKGADHLIAEEDAGALPKRRRGKKVQNRYGTKNLSQQSVRDGGGRV